MDLLYDPKEASTEQTAPGPQQNPGERLKTKVQTMMLNYKHLLKDMRRKTPEGQFLI